MKTIDAMKTLMDWDNRGWAVFTIEDLRAIFPERSAPSVSQDLHRLVKSGVLERAARGVEVNPLARSRTHVLEQIAVALRRGNTSYRSLESALAYYRVISQQTIACVTVMTTGRKGHFGKPYGTVSFTHTERSVNEILVRTVDVRHPLRLAHPRLALEDLRRVGRNLDLPDTDDLEEIEKEMGLAA